MENDELLQERTLSVVNYGDGEDGEIIKTRVTISPGNILFIIASYDTALTVDGLELRKVNAMLSDGGNLELFITLLDLTTLERCVGFYMIGQ